MCLDVAVTGCFTGSAGDGVFVNLVFHPCFTKLGTKLCVVFHSDALIVYNNAGSRSLYLFGKFRNLSLLRLKNLCAWHSVFTS